MAEVPATSLHKFKETRLVLYFFRCALSRRERRGLCDECESVPGFVPSFIRAAFSSCCVMKYVPDTFRWNLRPPDQRPDMAAACARSASNMHGARLGCLRCNAALPWRAACGRSGRCISACETLRDPRTWKSMVCGQLRSDVIVNWKRRYMRLLDGMICFFGGVN